MALGVVQDPNGLSQGGETSVTDMVFGAPTGNQVTVTSAGTNLPVLVDNEFIEIRNHSQTVNNGLYRVNDAAPTAGSVTLDKVSGSNPVAAASETASTFSSIRNAETATFANASGRFVDITGTGLPSLPVGARFDIEDHSVADNNGTYEVSVVNTDTSDYTCEKLDPSTNPPQNAASEALTMVTDGKSVMFETAARHVYLLEQWGLDLDGVLGQAFYSFVMISWKDDDFLIGAAPFPMLTIDADAGKYVVGQDPSGNNNGWAFQDVGGENIRSRKLLRNMGWSEIASDGFLNSQYAGIRTLGSYLDETPGTGDLAYYRFGDDTTVDDRVDFEFTGPVNEAVLVYNGLATPADTGTGFAITLNNTITRNDGGNWRTDGYKVGGQITILTAEDPGNVGTFVIASVQDLANGALVVEGTPLTNNAADTVLSAAVDNRNGIDLLLRVRTTPGNSNPRTFDQSNLAKAGETTLSNRLFTFGLANSQDTNIAATDADIDTNVPYTGMSITFHSTPQSRGGGGALVGGPYNFGIIIEGNGGTNQEVYEWMQRQLRKSTDIDADADTAIGTMIDGIMAFVGTTLEVGSVDSGGSFPRNPDGGGSGVYIDNLSATSSNFTVYYDNTGTVRQAPETIPVTLDFNQTLIDDTVAKYTLYFDYTIRTVVPDLVITAGTGANGTFDSAGANLPASLDAGAGAYVRISGLTGADAAMNGVYQVTSIVSASQYNVTRYDGATIVTTSSASANLDEHPIDSPDFIIVEDNLSAPVTGLASSDFQFSFDYSNNAQGGRTPGTDADVQARAIGQQTAQFTQSTVQTIQSGTPLTIPLSSAIERNFLNP